MFSKLAVVATVAFAIFAAAVPTPGAGTSCSTGQQACCDTTESSSANPGLTQVIAGLLSLNVGDITGMIGLGCTTAIPILGGDQCSQQSVCCDDVDSASLIGINCTPINVN